MSSATDRFATGGPDLDAYVAGRKPQQDPLGPVLQLGDRAARVGALIGLFLALSTHGYASARAMMALFDMRRAVVGMRQDLHDFFWTEYEVDVPKEQPKAEEKPPEPEPEPPPPPPAPKEAAPKEPEEDPYKEEPPPPPSQAPKVLTQDPKEDEPLDLTGKGFVSGDGSGPGYGMVSAAGTASAATFNPHASPTGVPGGRGTGGPPPPPSGPDRTKPAGLVGNSNWDCPFPPEADAEQIDQAVVTIMVTVRPDGSAQAVKVVSDPGNGFGRAARVCALSRRYTPQLDREGSPTLGTTPPINVRFTR